MDFDDLLFNTFILLSSLPNFLYKYQQKFKFILVDEYQDTNHAQYLIIKKLAADNENICVVGDDAQSIYAFSGANIQNILNLKRIIPMPMCLNWNKITVQQKPLLMQPMRLL